MNESDVLLRNNGIELRYYAEVVKCYRIRPDPSALKALKRMYIWTPEHVVKRFAPRINAYVWLMRVFRMKSSTFTTPLHGMIYAMLKESVSTDSAKSVVSEKHFVSATQYIDSCLSDDLY